MEKNSLTSRVMKTELINWREMQFLQDGQFKKLPPEAKEKLRRSLVLNRFTQPFYVWQDPQDSVIYCLDGWHRAAELREMEQEGWNTPELLEATFIQCENKQEAAKLVLLYSSMYAQVTEDGLFNFIKVFELHAPELFESINLPDIDMKATLGDIDRDFSLNNQELNLEDFGDEVILKLKYSKADFLDMKSELDILMRDNNYKTIEEAIRGLIKYAYDSL